MPPLPLPHTRLIYLRRRLHSSLFVPSRFAAAVTGSGIRLFSSSSASATAPPFLSFLPFLNHDTSAADYNPDAVAATFKNWFKKPDSLIDHIYDLLAFTNGDKELDAALSSLDLPLDESFVRSVLLHRPRLAPSSADGALHTSAVDVKDDFLVLRIKFFDWAGRQRHYRHSRVAYHTMFKLLAKANHASTILRWLNIISASFRQGSTLSYPNFRFHDTLVVGYSVAGHPDAALRVFTKMRFQGLDLDTFTYHVLFNALVEARAFDISDFLCRQMVERGHAGPFTSFIRVKGLCKQGMLGRAKEVLVRELGPYAGPLQSQRRFSGSASLDWAVAILAEALCKKRNYEEAKCLIDDFGGSRSYFTWFNNHIDAWRVDAAIGFLHGKRQSVGYVPEVVSYNKLIYHLLLQDRLEEFYDFLMDMKEAGVKPDRGTINATLCFLCKAGMVDVATNLYHSRQEIGLILNTMAVNHLINAFCGERKVDMACAILEVSMKHGYFPGRQTFNLLVEILCREGELDKMDKLLDAAIKRGVKHVGRAYGQYLSTLSQGGKTEDAFSVLSKKSMGGGIVLNSTPYVCLIYAFINLKRGEIICWLLMQMQESGHVPRKKLFRDVISCLCEIESSKSNHLVLVLLRWQLSRKELDRRTCYNYFISGLGDAKQPELAVHVFRMMVNEGIEISRESQILMLICFLKSKRIGDAWSFFRSIKERCKPSMRIYNVLITGLCKAEEPDQAYYQWKEVRGKSLIPGLHCYEELIRVLCSCGDYPKAVEVIEDFEKTGRPLSPFICNIILYHTMKTPKLKQAWIQCEDSGEVIGEPVDAKRDGVQLQGPTLRQLAFAFSGGIRITDNLDRLDEVVAEVFPVNLYTHNILLSGLSQLGKMDDACNIFRRMCRKGYFPNRWTYDFMVYGFCVNEQKNDAEMWMNKMYQSGYYPTRNTENLFRKISDNG